MNITREQYAEAFRRQEQEKSHLRAQLELECQLADKSQKGLDLLWGYTWDAFHSEGLGSVSEGYRELAAIFKELQEPEA